MSAPVGLLFCYGKCIKNITHWDPCKHIKTHHSLRSVSSKFSKTPHALARNATRKSNHSCARGSKHITHWYQHKNPPLKPRQISQLRRQKNIMQSLTQKWSNKLCLSGQKKRHGQNLELLIEGCWRTLKVTAGSSKESLVHRVSRVQVDFSSSRHGTTVMCPVVGPVVEGCDTNGVVNMTNAGRHGVPELSTVICVSGIDVSAYLGKLVKYASRVFLIKLGNTNSRLDNVCLNNPCADLCCGT